QHADQPRDLVAEDLHHLGVALVLRLAQLRAESAEGGADAAGLEERVLDGVDAPDRVGGEELPELLGEGEQEGTRLPHHEAGVLEHGDLVVGVELQELGSELLVLVEVHPAHLVGYAELLERDRGLAAVRGLGRVQADHRDSFGARETRRYHEVRDRRAIRPGCRVLAWLGAFRSSRPHSPRSRSRAPSAPTTSRPRRWSRRSPSTRSRSRTPSTSTWRLPGVRPSCSSSIRARAYPCSRRVPHEPRGSPSAATSRIPIGAPRPWDAISSSGWTTSAATPRRRR